MPQIKNIIEENTLDMEVIVNPKVLDGGLNVIQLETAVGAAMKCFEGHSIYIRTVSSYCLLPASLDGFKWVDGPFGLRNIQQTLDQPGSNQMHKT